MPDSTRLVANLSQLNQDCLAAIRDGLPADYEQMLDTYLDVLVSFADEWRRYGEKFTPTLAGDLNPLGLGLLDRIFRDLQTQARAAARAEIVEIPRALVGLPYRLVDRAGPLEASALIREALDLLVAIYWNSRDQSLSPTDVAAKSAASAATGLKEVMTFYFERTITDTQAPIAFRRAYVEYLLGAYERVNNLLKFALDFGDTETLEKLDSDWSEVLHTWHPEDHPNDWDIKLLRQTIPAGDPRLSRLEQQAKEAAELHSALIALYDRRAAYRFGLASWSLHRLRRTRDEKWRSAFGHFSAHFGSAAPATSAADAALTLATGPGDPWITWYFDEAKARSMWGSAHADFLSAYIALTARTIGQAVVPTIAAESLVAARIDEVEQLATPMKSDPSAQEVIGGDGIGVRIDNVIAGLKNARAAREAQKLTEVRAAQLDQTLVTSLADTIRTSWERHRLAPVLFRLAGAYEEVTPPTPEGAEFGLATLVPKAWLVADTNIDWLHAVEDFGQAVARGEVAELLKLCRPGQALRSPGSADEFRDGLVRAIDGLRAQGQTPTVVILSPHWPVERLLDPEMRGHRGEGVDPLIPREARRWFLRPLNGVAAFSWPEAESDRIWIADLARLAHWQQIQTQGQHPLRVSVIEVPAAEGAEPQVRLEVFERFRLSRRSREGAPFLPIPDELLRG